MQKTARLGALAIPRTTTRWVIYGVVLALAFLAARDGSDDRIAAPAARQSTAHHAEGLSGAPAVRVSEVSLERLAARTQRGGERDPFNALAPVGVRRSASSLPVPVPPQAPPLAFSYLGKLIEPDRTTVFLADGGRNWAVRAGDTIDGAYRVEAIGDRTMTLTYLALGTRQELEIGAAPGAAPQVWISPLSAALPVAVSPRDVAPLAGEARLLLAAPSRVVTGNELIVSLGLPPGGVVRDARVDLAYDPKVLAPVGAPDGGGRVSVALAGTANPLAQVRFKVVAESATETQIVIERVTATDARAGHVAIAAPGAYGIAIVARSRAN